MTFSLIGRQDGRFGMAVCSSSPAVAARCIHLRPGVGAAASQNVTDPSLGTALLDRLATVDQTAEVLAAVVEATPHVEYRQLTVLGSAGPGAWFSGAEVLGTFGAAGTADAVAAGNMLADRRVPQAMADAFESTPGQLEERLMAALVAAVGAGGEEGPVHSAGLAVVDDVPWRTTDLRVDWHDDPVGHLADLLELWLPQRDDYRTRALDPSAAPSYGVPGNA
jgi:uncharacterized Ntn-hydrolase superfamily protein